jgi:hypothetical protein
MEWLKGETSGGRVSSLREGLARVWGVDLTERSEKEENTARCDLERERERERI